MVAIGAEKDSLANKYAADAPYGTVFSADPGTTGAATNELSGGSPAFARKPWGWSTSTGGAGSITGSATFDIPAGATAAYVGACASTTLTTADVKDKVAVTSQSFVSQGSYLVNATFTES